MEPNFGPEEAYLGTINDDVLEGKVFVAFEKLEEFTNLQRTFLELDLFKNPSEEEDKKEWSLYKSLTNILDTYQEQSYLLDPYLEAMVAPVVDCLRSHAKTSILNEKRGSPARVNRLALLLYGYVKCRGYKTIIRFFPHEIADLSIALDFLLASDGLIQDATQWALRYVVIVWLSLICMIPFDLEQFDDVDRIGYTAASMETSAKNYLGKAGLEREAAALLLSRLYTRQDTRTRFHPFLDWSQAQLDGNADVITITGIFEVLCEVVKSGSVEQIQVKASQLFTIANTIETKTLSSKTGIRKLRTKLVSRVALRLLPARSNAGRILTGEREEVPASDSDIDVPEEVEQVLEQLFEALQDKDTIVRWSAAKGVARISERLPADFADQVLETILGLFAIHSIDAAGLSELPAIAEATWHGACLACAETARRDLVASKRLPELIDWLSKAIYFDLRKGAHSIGSNVRDAAAYVIWALARTQDSSALAPHSQSLAQRLTAVALYDREIHIRRAASAAFQEHVGRNSLFPHGIDVLGKTDFYAVSVRRNAFLTAAPQVAHHPEYRPFLMNHVLNVVLRHWDPAMRELGSQSLRLICLEDLSTLGPEAIVKSTRLLDCIDISDLHGGLLALSEIAIAYRESEEAGSREEHLREIFRSLSRVPFDVVVGSRNAIVTAAACRLISVALTLPEVSNATTVFHWRKIIDHGLKHRTPFVQEAAADAMATVSKLVDSSATTSLGTVLGAVDYSAHNNALSEATPPKLNVEARRNCYQAIPRILSTVSGEISRYLSPETVNSLYDALLKGLDDYSTDERGDVGSWIRVACIRSLTTVSELLIRNASSLPALDTYLPPAKYHEAISGILKQGVERLDNVRQTAGECFLMLLELPPPAVNVSDAWLLPGLPTLRELFSGESTGWNEAAFLFPKAVQFLQQRPLSNSLVSYAKSLPVTGGGENYDLNTLVEELIARAKTNVASNAVVIPIIHTFNVLLEGDALIRLSEDARGIKNLQQLLSITATGVARLKSVPRIQETMKLVVNFLPFQPLFETIVPKLLDFLGHQFPSIRSSSAEYLYVFLQGADIGKDTDEVEELLLETEWSSPDGSSTKGAAESVVELLLNGE
ncbi:hypothetical protein DXG03_004886 [Asterophora parasitica]|uniref:Tubulin-specific chaperone D n=1 Tax=Asterophora parasitica TaxID=117018 RepID=A0A9P7KG73_9AGAR|nr:hypothetical protein DXG03_004886 [Asterophora parasitica]